MDEPLLSGKRQFTLYPIKHHDIWRCYKLQQACNWVAEEIDFSTDREQFNTRLTDAERHFVKSILTFFAGADSLVALNCSTFSKEVSIVEAQVAYRYQAAMEDVHAEVYSIMIETFIPDTEEKNRIYDELNRMTSVIRKVAWAEHWNLRRGDDAPFRTRLVAFAIVEGLFFSGAFCAIYWIKQRNLLPGLTKSNEYIARDEGQHTEFACLMYSKLSVRMPEEEVHKMFREAVNIEKEFINESIPCRMVGMNVDLMRQYIEYVADNLLKMLGYSAIFGSNNPFNFMDLIGMGARSNFFEERSSDYQRANILNADEGKKSLIYTDDF